MKVFNYDYLWSTAHSEITFMAITRINFYAPDARLLDKTPAECENFRNWAKQKLFEKFPLTKIVNVVNAKVLPCLSITPALYESAPAQWGQIHDYCEWLFANASYEKTDRYFPPQNIVIATDQPKNLTRYIDYIAFSANTASGN